MLLREIVGCAMGRIDKLSEETKGYLVDALGEKCPCDGTDQEIAIFFLEEVFNKVKNEPLNT